MSTFTIPTIWTAVDKMSPVVSKMSAGVQNFAQKAEVGVARLDRRMRRLTPSLGGLGKQMLGFAATGALIGGVGAAVNTIKDFEQANADLNAVMNTSSANQQKLFQDASRLGGETAKTATEVVGLQEAFARLGFATDDIINMTEATISGSIAMNAELADTAELTGAMIKTFDNLKSTDTTQIMDQMTLATQRSALNFEKLQTALPIVGSAAEAAGVGFEQTLALLGKLSDAGIDASSSSTALRNIFLDSAKQGLSYDQILGQILKNQDKLTAANDQFGKRGAVSAVILAKNIQETANLSKELEKAKAGQENAGAASIAAAKRADTLTGRLTLLGSAWDGILIKANNNTGAIGFLNRAVDFLTRNLETITTVAVVFAGTFLAIKTALFVAKASLVAYNIILGISSALSGTAAVSVGANTVALTAYNIMTKAVTATTKVWTGVQWAINAAMTANPIGLIIVAIAALIGFIVLLVDKWESWGAAMSMIIPPIGIILSMIMSLKKNWDLIKNSFSGGGIIEGIKAIGRVLLDSLLAPMQQLLTMIDKIPGLDIAGDFAQQIQDFRNTLDVESTIPAINPKEQEQKALTEKIETSTKSNATMTIIDPNNRTKVDAGAGFPTITTTQGI